jgi:choline dehydrogenase-like flavoprotein
VNGMGYDRGTQPDYDAWGELGNDNWSWNNLLTYFKKVSQSCSIIGAPC